MTDPTKVLAAMALLFLACTVYAIVLDRHPQWYVPDGTIWTVIIGVAIIITALGVLELWGVAGLAFWVLPPRTLLTFLAFCVGGFPIAVWQFIQRARNNGRRQGRSRTE